MIKRIEAQYLVLQKLQEVYQAKRQEHKAYHDKMAEIDGNNNFSLKKTIQRERNRNQKLKTKMNETKADLKLQRDKINKFRKERTLLDKMYNKLEVSGDGRASLRLKSRFRTFVLGLFSSENLFFLLPRFSLIFSLYFFVFYLLFLLYF